MLEGLIYSSEPLVIDTIKIVGEPADSLVSLRTDGFIIDDLNLNLAGKTYEERLAFLKQYDFFNEYFFIEPMAVINTTTKFFNIGKPQGIGLPQISFSSLQTSPLDSQVIVFEQSRDDNSISRLSGTYPKPAFDSGLNQQVDFRVDITTPTNAGVRTIYYVNRVIGIDINYFMRDFPTPPNPNNSRQAIITSGDNINWREEWKMSLPPAETKQPLANNTLPLNVLRFLK